MCTKYNSFTNFNFLIYVCPSFWVFLRDPSILWFFYGRCVLVRVTLDGSVVYSDVVSNFLFRWSISSSIGVGWIFSVFSKSDWEVNSTSGLESSGIDVWLLDILNAITSPINSLIWVVNVRVSSLIYESTTFLTTVFTSSIISMCMSFVKSLTDDFHGYAGDGFSTSITSNLYWPSLSLSPWPPLSKSDNE